jgi:hypothetical protein
MSIERDVLVKLQASAFEHFVRGLLTQAKLYNVPRVHQGLINYLKAQGMTPDDQGVLGWLQDNTGDLVGGFVFLTDDGKIDFLITTGTQAELRQIGEQYVKKGDNSQRTTSVRQINLGEKARIVQPGVIQEGQ